jgi:hypothetical protein
MTVLFEQQYLLPPQETTFCHFDAPSPVLQCWKQLGEFQSLSVHAPRNKYPPRPYWHKPLDMQRSPSEGMQHVVKPVPIQGWYA